MSTASLLVDGRRPAAAIAEDAGSDSEDHLLQEPQFVLHAMDDDDARRPPARRAPAHLPIQPVVAGDINPEAVDRRKRLHSMIVPQVVLCCGTLILGTTIIYLAKNPDEPPSLTLVIVFSALIFLFSLVAVTLSFLGVYRYSDWPGLLKEWFWRNTY
ncbi:hypothetical protein ACP70R_014429 [Stipagrostis hirtigluma subsp. patula]